MTLKTAFALAAVAGALAFAAPRTAAACGMMWEPEPADEALLAEAADLEAGEQVYAALRTYERAMNDHRAVKTVRVKAALHVARLRAAAGDVAESNQAYARVVQLGAEAAIEAIEGDRVASAPISLIEPVYTAPPIELLEQR